MAKAKQKRRAGRPTRAETAIYTMESAIQKIDERSADILIDMFNILEEIARDGKQSGATRGQAARYIIGRAEEKVKDFYRPEKEDSSSDDVSEDFNQPLISSKFIG